ncbi:hypothetical protein ACEPAH_1684 [Sanghuangporus vaninii]
MLCSDTNRFALPGAPSTCALDTSITPIPSLALLAFLAIYVPTRFVLARRSRSSSSGVASTSKPSYDGYNYSSPSDSEPRSWRNGLPKWLHWLYIVLVLCLLGLRILEVVRLVLADMGVGLLPVGIIANVLNIMMLIFECSICGMGRMRSLSISASLVIYWATSTVLESVKVARLASYNSVHPAKGTAYPSSDWLLDNGCMLGLLVIFIFIEGTYLVLRWRSSYLPSPTPIPIPVKEKTISNPRPISEYEYDPVIYYNQPTNGAVA